MAEELHPAMRAIAPPGGSRSNVQPGEEGPIAPMDVGSLAAHLGLQQHEMLNNAQIVAIVGSSMSRTPLSRLVLAQQCTGDSPCNGSNWGPKNDTENFIPTKQVLFGCSPRKLVPDIMDKERLSRDIRYRDIRYIVTYMESYMYRHATSAQITSARGISAWNSRRL